MSIIEFLLVLIGTFRVTDWFFQVLEWIERRG